MTRQLSTGRCRHVAVSIMCRRCQRRWQRALCPHIFTSPPCSCLSLSTNLCVQYPAGSAPQQLTPKQPSARGPGPWHQQLPGAHPQVQRPPSQPRPHTTPKHIIPSTATDLRRQGPGGPWPECSTGSALTQAGCVERCQGRGQGRRGGKGGIQQEHVQGAVSGGGAGSAAGGCPGVWLCCLYCFEERFVCLLVGWLNDGRPVASQGVHVKHTWLGFGTCVVQ